jgi:hypothetical protein
MTSEMHAAPARATAPAPASELVLTDDQMAALQDAGLADFFDFNGNLPAYHHDNAWWLRTDDQKWGRQPLQSINTSLDERRTRFEKSDRNYARFMSIRRAASGFKESGTSDGQ